MNSRRAILRSGMASALILTLGALARRAPTDSERRLIDHYTNNDPGWALLGKTLLSTDRAKGVVHASFPAEVSNLAGRPFRISGYMTPLETSARTRHFIITRRSTTCPFCPPNEPTEAVEVRLDTPTAFTDAEVAVTGRMDLVATSDQGLFFRLSAARMIALTES